MRLPKIIKINIVEFFSYVILFSAIFNDILRVPNTKLSLFRLCSFIGLIIGLWYSKTLIKSLVYYIILAAITFLQSMYFISISNFGLRFNLSRYVEHQYYAFCIMIIILIVNVLFLYDGVLFFKKMEKFLFFCAGCYTLIIVLLYVYPGIRNYLYINNVNDYAACLAMLYPLIWKKFYTEKSIISLLLLVVIPVFSLISDCKLSFFAIVLQLIVGMYYINREALKKYKKLVFIFFVIAGAAAVYTIMNMNIVINGYDLKQMISDPVEHIVHGELYPTSDSSITYRTNGMIMLFKWIVRSKLLGIGFGNAGVMMKCELSKHGLYSTWLNSEAISPHNSLLEFVIEFGLIAVFLGYKVIVASVKTMKKSHLDTDDIMFVMVVLSSVLWLHGPSIIITDYLIFIGIMYYFINYKSGEKPLLKLTKNIISKS